MTAEDFVDAVRDYVGPSLETYGFHLKTSISGRMYSAEFVSPCLVVAISFEPGDDYLLAVVFSVTNGLRSDIDDRSTSPRLSDLNKRFLTPADASALADMRRKATDDAGPQVQQIRRIGAELSLVLPRYMKSLGLLQ